MNDTKKELFDSVYQKQDKCDRIINQMKEQMMKATNKTKKLAL